MLDHNVEEAITIIAATTQDHALLEQCHKSMEIILPHTFESVYRKRPLPLPIRIELLSAHRYISTFSGLSNKISLAKEKLIDPDDLQTQIVYSTLHNVLFESKADNLKKLDDTTSRYIERKSYDVDKLSALKRLVLVENYAIYALAVSCCIDAAFVIEAMMEYRYEHPFLARITAPFPGIKTYSHGEVACRIERIGSLYDNIKKNYDSMFGTQAYHLLYAQNDMWLSLHKSNRYTT